MTDESSHGDERTELLDDIAEMKQDARAWTEREGRSTRDEQVARLLDDRDAAKDGEKK